MKVEKIPIKFETPVKGSTDSFSLSGGFDQEAINVGTCTYCEEPATELEDDLSKKEQKVSGLCQICQDIIWPRNLEL